MEKMSGATSIIGFVEGRGRVHVTKSLATSGHFLSTTPLANIAKDVGEPLHVDTDGTLGSAHTGKVSTSASRNTCPYEIMTRFQRDAMAAKAPFPRPHHLDTR